MHGTRAALAGAVIGVAAAACGGPTGPTVGDPVADTATVACSPEGTTLDVVSVRPRPDGVHLQVENLSDEERMLLLYRHGSHEIPPGGTELVTTAPPGQLRVACLAPVEPEDPDDLDEPGMLVWPYPAEDEWTLLEVVDVDGLWVDDTLACDHPTGTHPDYPWDLPDASRPEGARGDPVDLARRDLPGEIGDLGVVRPGDVLERAGYPEAPDALVRLVRDGEVVATIRYMPDRGDGWHIGVTEWCEELEPGRPEPADEGEPADVEADPDDG
jgi:hypothetical protein